MAVYGNYIQYVVVTYHGKESEKEQRETDSYVTDSLCWIPEMNTL